ncbi:hypothetical protein [Zobellella sp. DQSA1]|uniref:hypothetical protein n=1 Tax=Zobellella sp. DQSA1 TaxID=3342386 RepID=UPI0035C18458
MLMQLIVFLVGLAGAAAIAFGAWLLTPAAGFIVGGGLAVFWSWLMAKSMAKAVPAPGGD